MNNQKEEEEEKKENREKTEDKNNTNNSVVELASLKQKLNNIKMFKIDVAEKNEVELLTKLIKIYSIVKLKEVLQDKEELVLVHYLKYGYNNDTKKRIVNEQDIDVKHLNQLNYQLTLKGILLKDDRNHRNKKLAPYLQEVQQFFVKEKNSKLIINFKL